MYTPVKMSSTPWFSVLLMKHTTTRSALFLFFAVLLSFQVPVIAEQELSRDKTVSPTLKKSVMSEGLREGLPVDQTIVFDVSKGSAYCWSNFDPVTKDGFIYHKWYRNGELIYDQKLVVHPPRWAAYSHLRLRKADVGPWRVDITDESGDILKTHRFSIME